MFGSGSGRPQVRGKGSMVDIIQLHDAKAQNGESPVWKNEESALYWTDIYAQRLHRYDALTGARREWSLVERLASFAFCEEGNEGGEVGGMAGSFHSGFALFNPFKGTRTWISRPLLEDKRVYFNDGRCDRSGLAYWTGSTDVSKKEGSGGLYRFGADGSCRRMVDGIISSNGIAFSPDNRTLYYADTRSYVILQFDHDPATGHLANRRVFVDIGEKGGFADGSAVDAEGYYWNARVHRGTIIRYRPDGTVEREIEVPTQAPTMVAFGGADLRTMYITSGCRPLSPEQLARETQAGSLFSMRVDVPGLPEPRFRPQPSLLARPSEPLLA